MSTEEYDSERVDDMQPAGGVLRDDADSAAPWGFNTGGFVGSDEVAEPHEGEEVLQRDEQEVDRTPDGRAILEFVYVGNRPEYKTQFGTYRQGEVNRLPENKVQTVLRMKQPDNSPAFKLASEL